MGGQRARPCRRGCWRAKFAPRVVVGGGELLPVRGPAVHRACGRERAGCGIGGQACGVRRAADMGYVVRQDRSGLAQRAAGAIRREYPRRQGHLVVLRGDAAADAAATAASLPT